MDEFVAFKLLCFKRCSWGWGKQVRKDNGSPKDSPMTQNTAAGLDGEGPHLAGGDPWGDLQVQGGLLPIVGHARRQEATPHHYHCPRSPRYVVLQYKSQVNRENIQGAHRMRCKVLGLAGKQVYVVFGSAQFSRESNTCVVRRVSL